MRLDKAPLGTLARVPAIVRGLLAALPLAILAVPATPALAQRDDPGLQLNCANDYFRLCAGVDPQSPQADACMNRNRARLSKECKAAISTYEDTGTAKRGR